MTSFSKSKQSGRASEVRPDSGMELTKGHRRFAGNLADLLGAFIDGVQTKDEHSKSVPLNYLCAFCLVAIEQGLSVEEYAERARVPVGTMSRHLLDIGDRNRKRPGLGLVTSRPNPTNRRKSEYLLTAKGVALARQLGLAFRVLRKDAD
jgi:DNA-binding MarR family transcriptional regulator